MSVVSDALGLLMHNFSFVSLSWNGLPDHTIVNSVHLFLLSNAPLNHLYILMYLL